MKYSCTFGVIALLGLAACGGEREAEEPLVAEEREGEIGREGVIGDEEREGELAAEGEGVVGAEERE